MANNSATSIQPINDLVVPRSVFTTSDFAKLTKLLVGQDALLLPQSDTLPALANDAMPDQEAESRHRQASGLSLVEHWESLGYVLSHADVVLLSKQDLTAHAWMHRHVTPALRERLGGHVRMDPMYPNFPKQVMSATEAELLLNALAHYVGDDLGLRVLPEYTKLPRKPLRTKDRKVRALRLVNLPQLRELLSDLVTMNTVWTPAQAELAEHAMPLMLAWGVVGADRAAPQRENQARMTARWLRLLGEKRLPPGAEQWPCSRVSTTDILRAAVAYSGGDPSLASSSEKVRFAKLSRPQRRALMGAFERAVTQTQDPVVDLHAHRQSWLRLGEQLHVGEWSKHMPKAVAAMAALRNQPAPQSWQGKLDALLGQPATSGTTQAVADLFAVNPGYAARALVRVLRWAGSEAHAQTLLSAFEAQASKVDTPVLLTLEATLRADQAGPRERVMLPKGQAAWRYRVGAHRGVVSNNILGSAAQVCASTIEARFSALPALGSVYVEDGLDDVLVPKGLRSASDSVAVATRGSALPVGKDAKIVRLFLWWKDAADRYVDVDLSAVGMSSSFSQTETCNFQALRGKGLVHSGDFVSAPDGAAEFVDVHLDALRSDTRYIVLAANVYSGPAFSQLPECFVGWQERTTGKGQRGEVMELATVVDKFRVTANSKGFLAAAFDVKERKLVWLDLPINTRSGFSIHHSGSEVAQVVEDFQLYAASQPKLSRLIELHIQSRGGTLVDDPAKAEVVFSVTPRLPTFDGQQVIAATQPQVVASRLLVGPSAQTAAPSSPQPALSEEENPLDKLVIGKAAVRTRRR